MAMPWHSWMERIARLARPRQPEQLPVQLQRQRIYVLPTPFGGFVTVLLLTMLLGALNYNNNPALLLALLLGAAAIASTIIAHLQLSGLRIEAIHAEPTTAGTALHLRVSLSCVDLRRRSGLCLELERSRVYCSLQAHSSNQPELQLETLQRGWREVGRMRISSTHPLGLVRAWAWVWPQAPLLVYPRSEYPGPPLPTGDNGPIRSRLHAQGEELHQLRLYRQGDARRAIAWKHSARRHTLLVREYEPPHQGEVVLDWRTLTALPYESRIARLSHWVNQAEREGRRYQLLLPGPHVLGPAQGPQHRHRCLRALALLPHG